MQGSLDLREFTAAVRKQGHISSKTASEREVQVLFDMVDLDKSGQLSLSEWYTPPNISCDRVTFPTNRLIWRSRYLFLGLTKDGEPKDGGASPKSSPKPSPRPAGKPSPQASPRSSDGEGGAGEKGKAKGQARRTRALARAAAVRALSADRANVKVSAEK